MSGSEWLLPGDAEAAVYDWARANARITALVGGAGNPRIYYGVPSDAPETAFPMLIVQRIGGPPDPGETPVDQPLIQFDALGPQSRLGIADGKPQANQLAGVLAQEIFRFADNGEERMNASANGMWAVAQGGPFWSPDPGSGRARYVLTVQFGVKAAEATVIA